MTTKPEPIHIKTLKEYLDLSMTMAQDMAFLSIPKKLLKNDYLSTYLYIRKAFIRSSSLCWDAYKREHIAGSQNIYIDDKKGVKSFIVEDYYLLLCLEFLECVKRAEKLKFVMLYDSNPKLYNNWQVNPKATAFEYAAKSVLEAIFRSMFWLYDDIEDLLFSEDISELDKYPVSNLNDFRNKVVNIVRHTWPMPPWNYISLKKEFQTLLVQLDCEYDYFLNSVDITISNLEPKKRLAFQLYEKALKDEPALNNATYKEIYAYMRENLEDAEQFDVCDTWSKYVKQAKNYFGISQKTSRSGRPYGKSIVQIDQI